MVEVFSVETTLRLNDQLIAGLRRVSEQLRAIDAQWTQLQARMKAPLAGLQAMRTELSGIKTETTSISTAMRNMRVPPSTVGNIQRLETALGAAETRAAGLARSLAAVGAAGRGAGIGGGGHGGGGGSGRGGLIYRGRGPAGVHAHTGISMLEMGAIGATFGMFEGTKMAAGEELAYHYAMLAAGVNPASAQGADFRQRLQEVAEATSRGTIYSRPEVAKTMPGIAGMAAVPLDKALPFMPTAIRFGEIERQMGVATTGQAFSAQESAGAAIRMAHLLGISDPSKFESVLDLMAPATFTSHTSPANLVKVLQYMMGSAAGVGMSQGEAVNLGALGSILMPGTRAGTSINMMLQGMMPKGGPAGGTRMERASAARRSELVKMGLIDPKSGQLFKDSEGGVLSPMLQHLHEFYEKVGPEKAYSAFVQEFAQRGARAAFEMARNPNLVSTNLVELERRETEFSHMGGVGGVQQIMNQTLWNQSLLAWANLKTIITDLANGTVPRLTVALNQFNKAAGNIRGFLHDHPDLSTGIGWSMEGVGALLLARMAKRLLWGSTPRAAAAAAGAGGAEAAGGGVALGALGALARRLIGSSAFRFLGPVGAYFGDMSSTADPNADQPYPTLQDWAKKNKYIARQLHLSEMAQRVVARATPDPFGGEYIGGNDLQQLRTRELKYTTGAPGESMPPVHVENTVTGTIAINLGELGQIIKQFVLQETNALRQGALGTGARPSRQVAEHSF